MRDCARFLFNHNPFYPLSAALIMFGLREAMQAWGPAAENAWWLALWLATYTVLLAVTAVVIIRVGQVWDDARTICLLVVLMFMAMSSSFDTLCIERPRSAELVLAAGWCFSVLTTEWLTRWARFQFPLLYRAPFYLLLGLFFGFPVVLSSPLLTQLALDRAWQVMGFSALAGLMTLTLIPAVRRGSSYVDKNGSPWTWPLYPWSIFFIVTVGVCGRAYLLTLSFQNDLGTQSSFGGYYLVPLAMGILIVLFEVAVIQQNRIMQGWMLTMPWLMVGLALIPGTSAAYEMLLSRLIVHVGSPLWWSLLAALALVLYMGVRGARHYPLAALPLLLMLIGVGPSTRTLWEAEPVNVWPMILIVAYQWIQLLRAPDGFRFSVAWMVALVSAVIYWRDTPLVQAQGVIPWHLALVGIWFSCLAFNDRWARYWRRRLPAVVLALALVAGSIWLVNRQTDWRGWLLIYLVAMGLGAGLSWCLVSMKLWKWSALGIGLIAGAALLWSNSWSWSSGLPPRAVQSLVLGVASFMIGGAISAAKAGLRLGGGGWLNSEWQAVAREWHGVADNQPASPVLTEETSP